MRIALPAVNHRSVAASWTGGGDGGAKWWFMCYVKIAVPRSGSLRRLDFTQVDYETHTLAAVENKPATFVTLNGKVCHICQLTKQERQLETVASVVFQDFTTDCSV